MSKNCILYSGISSPGVSHELFIHSFKKVMAYGAKYCDSLWKDIHRTQYWPQVGCEFKNCQTEGKRGCQGNT